MVSFTLVASACKKTFTLDTRNVERIEVYQGFPEVKKIEMVEGFEKKFIADLKKSKEIGPTKFMKSHRILIHYSNEAIDTIYSNGIIHKTKKYYRSDENIIKKYSM